MDNQLNQQVQINYTQRKIFHHCDTCNFNSHSATEWFKHIETKKHLRKGIKISDTLKCEICGLSSVNSYNFNIHKILIHGTPEDRKTKAKYYCDVCDIGFFCQLYYDKHILSKKHTNIIKYNDMIKQENDINNINNINNNIEALDI